MLIILNFQITAANQIFVRNSIPPSHPCLYVAGKCELAKNAKLCANSNSVLTVTVLVCLTLFIQTKLCTKSNSVSMSNTAKLCTNSNSVSMSNTVYTNETMY